MVEEVKLLCTVTAEGFVEFDALIGLGSPLLFRDLSPDLVAGMPF